MQHQEASRILNYTVSYLSLEMEDIKFFKNVSGNHAISFLKAISPNTSYFLYLYKRLVENMSGPIGCDPEKSKLESFLTDDNVILYSLILQGVPKGFFVLDYRHLPVCDLAYFGLFDDVTGKGLGKFMMNRVFEEVIGKVM